MREERLRRALRRVPVPDQQGAEERAWRIVSAAFAERDRTAPRGRTRLRLAWIAIAIALLALLISPAGAAVRHWVGDAVDLGQEPSSPALNSLPAPGQILVESPRGRGSSRRTGPSGCSGTTGRRPGPHAGSSLAPRPATSCWRSIRRARCAGRSLAGGQIRAPAWNSPDGVRIVYLDGDSLRVVAGDGTDDRMLRRRVARVAAAWQPGTAHVLAFAAPDGSVHAIAVDTGRRVLDTGPSRQVPVALAWSADGSRLIVARRSGAEVLDPAHGTAIEQFNAPRGTRISALAASPVGHDLALILRFGGRTPRSTLVLVGNGGKARRLFPVAPGVFSGLAFSPDGRWLLLAWQSADQWVFLHRGGRQRIVAVSNISRQFSPGGTGPAEFPRIAGWCCSGP